MKLAMGLIEPMELIDLGDKAVWLIGEVEIPCCYRFRKR